ncbi:MAG: hypothetical protein LBQ47_04225 [Endomicrobium sp.]|jgi:hypothetical protein|nr:hypothetical protein [Endomicrobium sp.]
MYPRPIETLGAQAAGDRSTIKIMKKKDQIQLLMAETGCEQNEAEFALSLSGDNTEKAIATIGILLKFITAFKIKLILPQENVYGLIQIALNMKTAEVLRSSIVLSHNPSVYEIAAAQDWFSFEKAIFSARLDPGAMEIYTQSVEENFTLYIKQAVKEISKISYEEIEDLIKAFFYPKPVTLEIISEELSLSQFKKLPNFDDVKNKTSFTGYDLGFVKLEVEILEDPNGKPPGKLSEGDTVLSLITDERDIAHYLAHLIGGRKGGSMIPLAAAIKKIVPNNDDFEIHLIYATSITGYVKVKKDKTLKVLETKNPPWWKKIMPW